MAYRPRIACPARKAADTAAYLRDTNVTEISKNPVRGTGGVYQSVGKLGCREQGHSGVGSNGGCCARR
jgi:hypothetical protein